MWLVILIPLVIYGLYNYIIVHSRANINAKANAREMKKAFPDVGAHSSTEALLNGTWKCKSCGQDNPNKINYCLYCNSNRFGETEKVNCPHCGALNNKRNDICISCRKSLKSEARKETPTVDKDPVALIKQLAELHNQGILSDEEYERKKAELLAKI